MVGNRNPYTKAGSSSIGFAVHAPETGFAAALRAGQAAASQEAAQPQKSLTAKPTASNGGSVDKEHSKRPPNQEALREKVGLAIGRKIDFSKKGRRWDDYQVKIGAQNRGVGREIPASKLFLPFVGSIEMSDALDVTYGDLRIKGRGGRNEKVRALMRTINEFTDKGVRQDSATEIKLHTASPNLGQMVMERSLDPDNPKWFAENDGLLPPFTDFTSIWQKADFEIGKIGGNGPDFSVTLADTSEVLLKGRDRVVNYMDDLGINVTGISPEWEPKVSLLETFGGMSIEGKSIYATGDMPLIMPLKSPHAYEASASCVIQ